MAKKYSQTKSKLKGFVWGAITFGLSALAYSNIFPLYKFGHYLSMTGVSAVIAYIAYVMGSGLDTSQQVVTRDDLIKTGNTELDAFVAKGQAMIDEIRRENDRIPDERVSAQIDEIEKVSLKIFRSVIEKPRRLPQLRRFMEYYLPMTLKILGSYSRMDNINQQKAEETKAKIETSLNIVITAFNNQLNKLYNDEYLDVTTDIEVLEKVFKRDDLIDGAMKMSGQAQATMDKKEEEL